MMFSNIGVANLVICENLKKAYFNDSHLNESKNIVSKFINTIKNSQTLQLEFKIFSNIENKTLTTEQGAIRYIDTNLKLLETYTLDEVLSERQKLNEFININDSYKNLDKLKLYESIDNLIINSLKIGEDIDVDTVHESFEYVVTHLLKNKTNSQEIENNFELLNEDIIKLAFEKYHNKYSNLNENEINLIKKLIHSCKEEKVRLYENLKNEFFELIPKIKNNETKETIQLVETKINNNINIERIDYDILRLFELINEIKKS